MPSRFSRVRLLSAVALLLLAAPVRATVVGVQPSATPGPAGTVFPQVMRDAAYFDALWCSGAMCPGATEATMTGLTVFNFGTAASPSALSAIHWRGGGGGYVYAGQPMTYAGLYTVDGGTYPAWTWSGVATFGPDPCATNCLTTLWLDVDISAAAAPGDTIRLGIGTSGGGLVGGLSDSLGGTAPAAVVRGDTLVVGVDVKVTAGYPLQMAVSGDVVQFTACWSNYSAATAFGFTMTDAIPEGTVYYPDMPANHYCGSTSGFGAATVAYSTTTNSPGAYATLTGPASTAVKFLRWTIPEVRVQTTGCVCFRVTVQ